jgi:hypothetical protein
LIGCIITIWINKLACLIPGQRSDIRVVKTYSILIAALIQFTAFPVAQKWLKIDKNVK